MEGSCSAEVGVSTEGETSLEQDARSAARGDLAAFGRLHHATVGRVFALAARLLGRAEAEEATQEAYLRAWRKLGSFRGEAGFATWLHRLSLNSFLSRRADLRRDLERSGDWEREPEERRARAGLRLDLEAAIQRLPIGARTVFVLHDVEGFTHEEIAQRLEVTAGTSKSQLHRARMLLRAALAPLEDDHG